MLSTVMTFHRYHQIYALSPGTVTLILICLNYKTVTDEKFEKMKRLYYFLETKASTFKPLPYRSFLWNQLSTGIPLWLTIYSRY